MIVVHHLEHSRSQRILWLLEELNLSYEIKTYQRDKETLLAPPELRQIHPLGKSPVITDDDKVIAESAVIIDSVVKKYGNGKLLPRTEENLQRYTYWLHYAEASLMTPLLVSLVFERVSTSPMPFFIRPIAREIATSVKKAWIRPELKLHLDYLENEISRTGWFAGEEFSAADIMMSYPLEAAESIAGSERPGLKNFLEKIRSRPAYERALKRGGPFSVMPVSSKK